MIGLLFILGYREFRPKTIKPSDNFLATVTDAVDLRLGEDLDLFGSGRYVDTERIRFESGILALRLKNGVRLVLEGPADLQLNTTKKIFCEKGRLSVSVPPKARGFEVITPSLSVIDLGTEFVLDISEDGTEVHTITGLVEVDRLPSGRRESLPAGKAIWLGKDKTLRSVDADPSLFVTDAILAEKAKEYNTILLERNQIRQSRWSGDPGLLIDMEFPPQQEIVANRAAQGTDGRVLGGVGCFGRYKVNHAYTIHGRNDGISFDVPQELRSFTLSISLSLNALDRYNQVLFASADEGRGRVYWQLHKDGSICERRTTE